MLARQINNIKIREHLGRKKENALFAEIISNVNHRSCFDLSVILNIELLY